MELKALLDLKEQSIISVVGAGGKTSFIFRLAQELRLDYKVLVTTTTKIFIPEREQYDFIAVGEQNNIVDEFCSSEKKGIYVLGSLINSENKLEGISETILNYISKYFDYVFVEADGSKRKPIKGWNEAEPVINSNTTATVGILDIQVLGKEINEDLVHRIDRFLELTGASRNHQVEFDHLEALIFSSKGLFKSASGEKVLFINKVESEKDFISASKLIKCINKRNSGYINKIIIGSLKNNKFSLELF